MGCSTNIKRRDRIVRTIEVILQLVLYSAAVLAQGQQTRPAKDTSRVHPVGIVEIDLWRPVLRPPLLLGPELKFEPLILNDVHYGVPPPLLGTAYESRPYVIRPYLFQNQADSKLNPLYSVLGAFELGGAAYIAYHHVKKYGLFH
jgi:hypothetical protein